MKVLEFIKTLFFPRKMIRFRNSTVFIAIFIFIISSYILVIPADYKVKHSFEDNIKENDLLYLQSIYNMPLNDPEVNEVIKEIYDKKISITNDDRLIQADNMKFDVITTDESLLGSITLSNDGKWIFNNELTDISKVETVDSAPKFDIKDGKLNVNNVYLKDINVTGEVETITISVNRTGLYFVNGDPTSIRCNNNNTIVSFNDEGQLLINNIKTGVFKAKDHAIVYYVAQPKIELYKNSIQYTSEEGKNVNITFVIDTSENGELYNPEEEFKYSNDKFPNIAKTEYYLILFSYNNLYYQAHPAGIDELKIEDGENFLSQTATYNFYTSINFNSDSFETTELAKDTLVTMVKTGYVSRYNTLYSIITFVYTFVFTLFIAFIFWLFFRKNGKLKTMREYYNIAGIANIACTLVSFVILWIYPDGIGNFYPFLFSIYYLFVLYRINTTPEAV